jgi:hypothetical protein
MRRITLAATAALLSANAAAAQSNARLLIEFAGGRVISPSRPAATIELWATWDDPFPPKSSWLLGVGFDFISSEPGLENAVLELMFPGNTWGTPGSSAYTNAMFGQIHLPPTVFANFDNLILLGTIDWRATDFSPRAVSVRTDNEWIFKVGYILDPGSFTLSPVTSGHAEITVIPCYVDCDGNTTLDVFDFLCFQDAFVTNDPYADCDGNSTLDIFDFLCFQDAFVAGCP